MTLLRYMGGFGRILLGLTLFQVLYMVNSSSSYDKKHDNFLFGENDTLSCQYFCDTSSNNDSYFPPNFIDKCPPPEVLPAYIFQENESGVEVFWTEPVAVDTNGDAPRLEQVIGDTNGSYFNGSAEGTRYDIVYLATDEDGLRDSCYFDFKVYDEVNCTTPVVVENGYYNCTNGSTQGSVCSYKCNEGYKVTGNTDVTCQSGIQIAPIWSAAPTCEVNSCMYPMAPINGIISCNDSTYSYNSICSVTCDKGFTAEGPLYMICQADGLWSRPTSCTYPEPLAVRCFSPQIFYPDSKQTSMVVNWKRPSSAAIDKNKIEVNQIKGPSQGDKLEAGHYTVVYKMTSKNSTESSECTVDLHVKAITCEHPANIFNDSFMEYNCSLPTFILGTSCEISCTNHFEIAGNTSITCVANTQQEGVWDKGSDHKIFCNDTLSVCPEIFDKPVNGQLIYNESDTVKEVLVLCENEFDLQYKFPGHLSCVDGEWTNNQIPECNVRMNSEYLLYAELNFYGQGCLENAIEDFLEYKETFQNDFDEYIITKCPHNETCRVFNLSVECIPTSVERVRKEIRGVRLDYKRAALHDVVKRSDTHKFVTSFNIEIEANKSQQSFDYHEDMLKTIWANSRNWVVAHIIQKLQVTDNFTMVYFRIINHTVPRCHDDHILEGSLCRTCSIGYFYNRTSDRCQTCPVGTFKDFSGLASCLFCPDRTSTKDVGSVSMNDCKEFCRPGSVSPDGLITCAVCEKGFYQDEFRQTECKKCPEGTTTVLDNSTTIRKCIVISTNDSCLTSSCNGHRCLSKNGSISCVCSYGWYGKTCEQAPDTCADNICRNKATCIDRNNSYACECHAHYSGLLCEITPVNGGWAEWSGWSECSVTCDQGIQQRTRQCTNPSPSEYGDNCHDQTSQDKVCVRDECQACQKIKETNSSYYQCTTDHKTGTETCSVRCKDGYIIGSWADGFRDLSCGMQTGFNWLPANVTLHCTDPIMPQHLLLESSIEYKELIPSKYHDMAKKYVSNKLLHTDCFKATSCKMEVSLNEVNQVDAMVDAHKQSKLIVAFQRDAERSETDENTKEVVESEINELKNAIEDMESTAKYLKDFTSEIFDIYILHKSRRRSVLSYIAVEASFDIHGNVTCENGQTALNGMCIECPQGTYSYAEKCHFCIKGTYQPDSGQTTCVLCLPDLTTDTIGAYHVSQCKYKETLISIKIEADDSDLTVVGTIVGIVTGILGIVLTVLLAYCCRSKHDKYFGIYNALLKYFGKQKGNTQGTDLNLQQHKLQGRDSRAELIPDDGTTEEDPYTTHPCYGDEHLHRNYHAHYEDRDWPLGLPPRINAFTHTYDSCHAEQKEQPESYELPSIPPMHQKEDKSREHTDSRKPLPPKGKPSGISPMDNLDNEQKRQLMAILKVLKDKNVYTATQKYMNKDTDDTAC